MCLRLRSSRNLSNAPPPLLHRSAKHASQVDYGREPTPIRGAGPVFEPSSAFQIDRNESNRGADRNVKADFGPLIILSKICKSLWCGSAVRAPAASTENSDGF